MGVPPPDFEILPSTWGASAVERTSKMGSSTVETAPTDRIDAVAARLYALSGLAAGIFRAMRPIVLSKGRLLDLVSGTVRHISVEDVSHIATIVSEIPVDAPLASVIASKPAYLSAATVASLKNIMTPSRGYLSQLVPSLLEKPHTLISMEEFTRFASPSAIVTRACPTLSMSSPLGAAILSAGDVLPRSGLIDLESFVNATTTTCQASTTNVLGLLPSMSPTLALALGGAAVGISLAYMYYRYLRPDAGADVLDNLVEEDIDMRLDDVDRLLATQKRFLDREWTRKFTRCQFRNLVLAQKLRKLMDDRQFYDASDEPLQSSNVPPSSAGSGASLPPSPPSTGTPASEPVKELANVDHAEIFFDGILDMIEQNFEDVRDELNERGRSELQGFVTKAKENHQEAKSLISRRRVVELDFGTSAALERRAAATTRTSTAFARRAATGTSAALERRAAATTRTSTAVENGAAATTRTSTALENGAAATTRTSTALERGTAATPGTPSTWWPRRDSLIDGCERNVEEPVFVGSSGIVAWKTCRHPRHHRHPADEEGVRHHRHRRLGNEEGVRHHRHRRLGDEEGVHHFRHRRQ
ncbi:hypothetical protein KFL_003890190 [Klebsormidium nitens]|uniref:Uncharacterized protein n=1 Tax=Klebsormidium nitens TaxID=105231 RepID=A0A1Y1IIG5_KLENI|nr:hypothetical protein KFL_003890190 [Klebsormidium nitens]|eukprot:GAQ87948.1 hypothetical protein KFL_003890190 [Klebsormidium nitens]